ncbi:MAG: hypothetical protein LUK37_26275 [Clostridia bacterium]|nr:hypothetical protein [Clostridia bacterium]
MELRVNEPGLFIEELVFQIRPELVKRYVELEYEIMAKELAGLDGFCGWQIWVSETSPGRVTSLYFWRDHASYRSIDQEWLSGKKDEISRVFGAENMTFVRAGHETDRRYQMRSLV